MLEREIYSVWKHPGRCLQACRTQISHLRDIIYKGIFSSWLLSVISSKDFKLTLNWEIQFLPRQAENAEHLLPHIFYFITFPNDNWSLVTVSHFIGLKKSSQLLNGRLKSIKIWPRYGGKQFHTFFILESSEPHLETNEWASHHLHMVAERKLGVSLVGIKTYFLNSLVSMALLPLPATGHVRSDGTRNAFLHDAFKTVAITGTACPTFPRLSFSQTCMNFSLQ